MRFQSRFIDKMQKPFVSKCFLHSFLEREKKDWEITWPSSVVNRHRKYGIINCSIYVMLDNLPIFVNMPGEGVLTNIC